LQDGRPGPLLLPGVQPAPGPHSGVERSRPHRPGGGDGLPDAHRRNPQRSDPSLQGARAVPPRGRRGHGAAGRERKRERERQRGARARAARARAARGQGMSPAARARTRTAARRSTVEKKRGRYHHGDLRRALLDAALGMLAREGGTALTLREVARRAGVTHAAPYRHFTDKQALLAAVAEEGFRMLSSEMASSAREATDPRQALQAIGTSYVRFA